jgi:hypothetical protein
MWIMSQRRNALVNINFMHVINDGNFFLICGATTDGFDCELGIYSSEKKVLRVLDEIEKHLEYPHVEIFQMPQDEDVEV